MLYLIYIMQIHRFYGTPFVDIRNKANRYWEERTYQNSNKVNHFRKYTGSDTYESLNIVPVLRLAEMYLILVEVGIIHIL